MLRNLGSEMAWVVCGADGMDELTLTGETHVAELKDGEIRLFEVTPEQAGLERADAGLLKGGNADANARELSLLLAGKRSAYRDVVLLNAAAALVVAGKVTTIESGVILAQGALDEGRAKEALAHLVRITNLDEAVA